MMDYMGKPTDSPLQENHEDQLALGLKLITTAFQTKMHNLEQEIKGLRITTEEQRNNVAVLQKKNSNLEVELVECHQRATQLAEEKQELFKTKSQLQKQISRLEHLKAAVMSSIQEDAAHEADMGEARLAMSEEYLKGALPLTAAEMGLAPPVRAMPPMSGLPHYQDHSSAVPSMGASHYGGGGPFSHVPPVAEASPSMVDGKAFFRTARSRLSYEAFNQFLASIKRLNNQQQSREDTLEEARHIFGVENQDLYRDFESLLNRHGM
mmetsp:Transcript_71293/g.133353  ORF Transcript_71293/g.133353 Transcript_71293/m.133353 type:complete len:266 (-) Transcript_71293:197-994(-)